MLAAGCGGREAPVTATAPAPLRYGVIGDSYSNGEGVGLEHSWPAQLARRLTAAGMPTEVVVNNSVTGWTSQQALDEELPEFERAKPQVATLQIGVNDWVQGVSAETFRANLVRLLDAMLAVVGAPKRLICVTIPDFSVTPDGANYTHGRDATAGLAAFNAVIESECAARDVSVVDVFGLSHAMDDPALTADDGLHPSAKELALWTDRIEPVAHAQWGGAFSTE
jgi:lysophospholipase L1-like esterase